jgi:hypothetical protein
MANVLAVSFPTNTEIAIVKTIAIPLIAISALAALLEIEIAISCPHPVKAERTQRGLTFSKGVVPSGAYAASKEAELIDISIIRLVR